MSKIKNKSEVGSMWGEKVSVTKINNKLVVQNRPERKIEAAPTSNQEAAKKKFLKASAWAKAQVDKPEVKALYATRTSPTSPSAYVVAMKDFLTPPEVELIDVIDYNGDINDSIAITASDDFSVTRVKVVITDAAGVKLEQGEAIQDAEKAFMWVYKTTVANPSIAGTIITATAFDRPGNYASLQKVVGLI